MPFDDSRTYVDTFSVSTGGEQMGGNTSSAQMGGPVTGAQMGENDIIGSSRRETLSELHRRHTPRQPQTQRPARQMGSGIVCSQQMG